MASTLRRYFLPRGMTRLIRPTTLELKVWARTWLNLLLPHRLLRYRSIVRGRDLKLHLGCGSRLFEGWVNVDMNKKGDVTLDLRERLPFADESVVAIFSEHTLEHFYREHDAPHLLRECLRLLVSGGILRITIPDANKFVRYYTEELQGSDRESISKSHSRFGGTPMDVLNSGFRWKHQHHYMYDFETFRNLLEEVGFENIQEESFRSGSDSEVASKDAEERKHETLYVEARKG